MLFMVVSVTNAAAPSVQVGSTSQSEEVFTRRIQTPIKN